MRGFTAYPPQIGVLLTRAGASLAGPGARSSGPAELSTMSRCSTLRNLRGGFYDLGRGVDAAVLAPQPPVVQAWAVLTGALPRHADPGALCASVIAAQPNGTSRSTTAPRSPSPIT